MAREWKYQIEKFEHDIEGNSVFVRFKKDHMFNKYEIEDILEKMEKDSMDVNYICGTENVY